VAASPWEAGLCGGMTPTGSERTADSHGESALPKPQGAAGGALGAGPGDAGAAELLAAWPRLSAAQRRAVLAVVRGTAAAGRKGV
jgi:hypothetical protein